MLRYIAMSTGHTHTCVLNRLQIAITVPRLLTAVIQDNIGKACMKEPYNSRTHVHQLSEQLERLTKKEKV